MNRPILTSTRSNTYLVILLLIAVGLAIVTLFIGPRIVRIEDNLNQLKQSTEVFTNSKITEVTSVSISPEIAYDITQSEYSFTLFYGERLSHKESYQVTATIIDANGDTIQLNHTIHTPPDTLYYLHRNSDELDQIHRTDLDGSYEDVVFEKDTILTFAVSQDTVYVLEQTQSEDILHAISIRNGRHREIQINQPIVITSLESSAYSDKLLINATVENFEPIIYIITSSQFSSTQDINEVATKVSGSRAKLVDDSSSFIYFQDFTSMFIDKVDTPGNPISIGNANDYLDTLFNNQSALLIRRNNALETIQSDGSSYELPDEINDYVGYAQFYKDEKSYVYLDHPANSQNITLFNEGNETILESFKRDSVIIRNLIVSSDGQYFSVEAMPTDTRIRTDLRINNISDETTTEIHGINDPTLIKSVDGVNLLWR